MATRRPEGTDVLTGTSAGPRARITGALAQVVRDRTELVVLMLLLVVGLAIGGAVPVGILGLGITSACVLALHALGIVLVYRANRVVNFAQLQMGTVAGALFVELVRHRTFVAGVRRICPGCVPVPAGFARFVAAHPDAANAGALPSKQQAAVAAAHGWVVQLNYWVSALLSLTLAAVLVWAMYQLVIKRFNRAPRLVLTVMTIGAGSLVSRFGLSLVAQFFPVRRDTPAAQAATVPLHLGFKLGVAVFSSADVLAVGLAVAACVGLAWFLRRTRTGIELRGAADNADRADTLGVNTTWVVGSAWLLAGILAGLASLVSAANVGPFAAGTTDQFVKVLAAAVAGGLVSLPLTLIGAVVFGIVERAVLYGVGSPSLVTGIVLLGIVVMLLAQHRRTSRAELDAEGAWAGAREIRPIPQELRSLHTVRTGVRWVGFALVLVVLGFPWFMSPGQIVLATGALLTGVVGLSLLILTGWAGQISLGQLGIAAVGAWTAAVLRLPFPLGIVAGLVAGAAAAVAVGIPSLRLRGLHLAITTLALSTAVSALLINRAYLGKWMPTAVSRPFVLGIDLDDNRAFYYLTLLLTGLAVAATAGVRRSHWARRLIASKDNPAVAQSFGVNLMRARLTAFAVSGAYAGMAGALWVLLLHRVDSDQFSPDRSIVVFLVAVIGGMGSVAGPLLGAAYLLLLDLSGNTALGPLAELLRSPGLGVVLLLIFAPGGISQITFALRDAWLRRVASRYRIVVPSLISDRKQSAGERAPVAPKLRPTGGQVFVPRVYRVDGQWGITTE
ncbi:MAG: branched-chain amino acid transport system permease protein livM [Acidimicrobiaceae bacterium]|jgi:branched-chain amino acid transport system permease protein|nr:branched-chain amino acid transport system permease protein livM [Acidimicrobiaceae bacterium]